MYPIKDFDHKSFIKAAEELLRSDETLMALKLLDMVPGYYRDNPIPEIHQLKREVMARLATSSFYATHVGMETEVTDEQCNAFLSSLRCKLISYDLQQCRGGQHVEIYDHGPGEYWLPLMLKKQDFVFWYHPVYVNHATHVATKHRHQDVTSELQNSSAPKIWVACEIIEHLHDESEIRYEMERRVGLADVIHISTPLYAFNPNMDHWKNIGDLGHLRTYTPREFQTKINSIFPEYNFAYYQSQVQHIRLFNPNSKFDYLKKHYEVQS